jgi:predicted branched-subunit amino acid permease
LIVGATATATGLPLAPALAMSYLVFAGSSQLAAYALIGAGSPIVVVLVTTLLLNLRFALYSATLAPHLRAAPAPLRALLAAIMTDQSMALGTARYASHPERGE